MSVHADAIVFTQIFVFVDNPVSIVELDALEEVWQVFIDNDLCFSKSVSPLSEQWIAKDAEDDNKDEGE